MRTPIKRTLTGLFVVGALASTAVGADARGAGGGGFGAGGFHDGGGFQANTTDIGHDHGFRHGGHGYGGYYGDGDYCNQYYPTGNLIYCGLPY